MLQKSEEKTGKDIGDLDFEVDPQIEHKKGKDESNHLRQGVSQGFDFKQILKGGPTTQVDDVKKVQHLENDLKNESDDLKSNPLNEEDSQESIKKLTESKSAANLQE